jgi:putative Mg2+ transporter-C (MgtC) family protein
MTMQETISLIDSMGLNFGVQLAASVICGAIVGTERQLRGKAIGIRTSILICLGTQVFIRLSANMGVADATIDPTRVLGQVVTGVGFLGAGVILAKSGSITGVTSAAVVWMLAAIGSTIGVGRPVEALILACLVVGILIVVRALESAFMRLRGGSEGLPDHATPDPEIADSLGFD